MYRLCFLYKNGAQVSDCQGFSTNTFLRVSHHIFSVTYPCKYIYFSIFLLSCLSIPKILIVLNDSYCFLLFLSGFIMCVSCNPIKLNDLSRWDTRNLHTGPQDDLTLLNLTFPMKTFFFQQQKITFKRKGKNYRTLNFD